MNISPGQQVLLFLRLDHSLLSLKKFKESVLRAVLQCYSATVVGPPESHDLDQRKCLGAVPCIFTRNSAMISTVLPKKIRTSPLFFLSLRNMTNI